LRNLKVVPINLESSAKLADLLNTDGLLRKSIGATATDNTAGSFLQRYTEWQKKTNSETFAIEKDGAAIGLISLSHRDNESKSVRIGYWISSKEWNKGIGTFAFNAVFQYAKDLGFKIFRANINPNNFASLRIWEKNGATFSHLKNKLEAKIEL